jgi:arsenate reductase
MPTLHGIKNCDTIKKARAWLEAHSIAYDFHDYRTAGIERRTLESWVTAVGWEPLLNRSGTTFRKLADADKKDLTEARALALMLAQPTLIKRPVLVVEAQVTVGFKPDQYAALFRAPSAERTSAPII